MKDRTHCSLAGSFAYLEYEIMRLQDEHFEIMDIKMADNIFLILYKTISHGNPHYIRKRLSDESGIDPHKILMAEITSEEWIELTNVAAFLVDTAEFTKEEIENSNLTPKK